MSIGLFGKLQSKRDFIALGIPRPFLTVWENWLQSAMATSKMQLGADWQTTYLTSPIWRFWIGSGIGSVSAMGALMPSMDQVGRYFPLSAVAFADPGTEIAPPDIDAQEGWFTALEDFLLSTLEVDLPFENTQDALTALARPATAPASSAAIPATGGALILQPASAFAEDFDLLRTTGASRLSANASFWWSAGGVDYQPAAMVCTNMPDPTLFTTMLTGRFAPSAAPESAGVH